MLLFGAHEELTLTIYMCFFFVMSYKQGWIIPAGKTDKAREALGCLYSNLLKGNLINYSTNCLVIHTMNTKLRVLFYRFIHEISLDPFLFNWCCVYLNFIMFRKEGQFNFSKSRSYWQCWKINKSHGEWYMHKNPLRFSSNWWLHCGSAPTKGRTPWHWHPWLI